LYVIALVLCTNLRRHEENPSRRPSQGRHTGYQRAMSHPAGITHGGNLTQRSTIKRTESHRAGPESERSLAPPQRPVPSEDVAVAPRPQGPARLTAEEAAHCRRFGSTAALRRAIAPSQEVRIALKTPIGPYAALK
jgi:hypothetical protein